MGGGELVDWWTDGLVGHLLAVCTPRSNLLFSFGLALCVATGQRKHFDLALGGKPGCKMVC